MDSGDLTEPITNPVTKEEIGLDKTVKVTYDCDSKTFTYTFDLNCT